MPFRFPWLIRRPRVQAAPPVAAVASELESSIDPISLPGGHSRFPSIAWPMIGVLVLIACWAVGVSYYFHQRGSEELFVAEQRSKAARAARLFESSLLADYAIVEAEARQLAGRPELAAALARSDGGDALREWAQRTRGSYNDLLIEVYNVRGELAERTGDVGMHRLASARDQATIRSDIAAGKERVVVLARSYGLTMRAIMPVAAGGRTIGAVVTETLVDAPYVEALANKLGVELGLFNGERVLAGVDLPAAMHPLAPGDIELQPGMTRHLTLSGEQDLALRPFEVGGLRLTVAVIVPNSRAYAAQSGSGNAFTTVVLFTILATIVAGLYLTRYLIRPVKALTERAETLSLRYAGRATGRRGDELDSLVGSFEAMTSALLSHSERLARAHRSELQNSLELQRQYAQMRLLRGLAAAANESDSVEGTLERALHEIGGYLDWPLGRVAMLQDGVANGLLPPRSMWFTRDAERFNEFIDASNGTPIIPSPDHLIGRAYLSGTPHWISDLSRMSDWNRLGEALDAGLQTGIVIPVVARGHVTAFIEFFCDHRVEATNDLLELLEAIGGELSRVAERQRAEHDLHARELEASRLAMVASRTEQMVLILDPQGRIEWANDATARFSGYSLHDIRGRLAHGLFRGPESDPDAISQLAEAIDRGDPCRVEFIAYTRSAERRVLEVEGQPLRDDQGRYFQYALISPDITERKRHEAALRESAEYFRALFDESPVPASIQAPDYRIVRANPAHTRMLGYTIDQLIGQDPIAFVHPDEVDQAYATRRELEANERGPITYERRMLTSDGETIWVRGHSVRFTDASGELYMLTMLENITEGKHSEQALRDAKEIAESASRAKIAVPRQHEPRDPHADERRARHDRAAARHDAERQAAALCRCGISLGREPARDHQRHPGFLEDRGRQART